LVDVDYDLSMPPRRQAHRARDDMRDLIVDLLMHSQRPLSRTEIAEAIQRRKSLNVNSLIEGLVEEGLVERTVRVYANGVQGYQYQWRR
jgi:predicted transcriptional regulator